MSSIFLNTKRTGDGISVEWDVRGVLPTDIARQLPYAASLALNRTAVEAVAVVREETAKHFTRRARSKEYFNQAFQVTQFSTKSNLEIAFGTSRGLLQGRGASLLHHEDGTDRVSKGRNDFPYIPVIGSKVRKFSSSMRPNVGDLLPQWAYPKALGLADRRGIKGETISGQERTGTRRGSKRGLRAQENRKGFILRDKDGDPVGIFRRVPLAGQRLSGRREGGKKMTLAQRRRRGSGQSTLEALFWTPKVIRIEPRLGFRKIADHVMVERIQANFEGMLAYALDDRRQRSNAAFALSDRALIAQFIRGGRR